MKHTVTKAFSLLLAVLILAVSLASCGGKDNDRVSALTGQIGAGAARFPSDHYMAALEALIDDFSK